MTPDNSGTINLPEDEALSPLLSTAAALGVLVRSYLESLITGDTNWLDVWFRHRLNNRFDSTLSDSDALVKPGAPSSGSSIAPLSNSVQLQTVQPHYFRGFRNPTSPIILKEHLTVVEGANSSGKTSLAESLEWLFVGQLSRRDDSRGLGNARELENCIGNQFRPADEETWVEATFTYTVEGNSQTVTLRRLLEKDYGTTSTSMCTSTLFKDGVKLSADEEREVLNSLFASVPPLLMQHTLRDFVESVPQRRTEYFEQLLQMERLTTLISKAVIGDSRLSDFPSPGGSTGLRYWEALGGMLSQETSLRAHKKPSRAKSGDDLSSIIDSVLKTIALIEFPEVATPETSNNDVAASLEAQQRQARQKSFPVLSSLRPKVQVSDEHYFDSHVTRISEASGKIMEDWQVYHAACVAAKPIGEDRLQTARAIHILLESGVINRELATQRCPICNYEPVETLTASRIGEAESWIPLQEAERSTTQKLKASILVARQELKGYVQALEDVLPTLPDPANWDKALGEADDAIQRAAQALRETRATDDAKISDAIVAAKELSDAEPALSSSAEECQQLIDRFNVTAQSLVEAGASSVRYRDAFRSLDAAIGAVAGIEPHYRSRDAWLNCHTNRNSIASDFRWEQEKRQTQNDLRTIRDFLIEYRQQFLEARRIAFNEGIGSVWGALRADQYSFFGQLNIPPPRGTGFPVEIEVKAVLNDGTDEKEVDALRVFSESQVNALGIAAFVTRSKMIGHKLLIFDDPVQSMDEDHFKTFARDVLDHLLGEGFQIVLLTHNDTFARDISHCHYNRAEYATMSVRLSKRDGCVVDEGSRRVNERLKLATKLVDEGRKADAWRIIRLAIERLYLVSQIRHGPAGFDPNSWRDHPAEYMWDNGAGSIIEQHVPGSGTRLKEILDMTVSGVHDKSPQGETNLRQAIDYLKPLPAALYVGG